MPHQENTVDEAEVIRKFSELRPDYEQLSSEVAFILDKRLKEESIPISLVTHRAKDLESLLEKIKRKGYRDPLKQNEDFAGVRVVHLFRDDFARITELIERDFKVIRRETKADPAKPREFGYDANHLVVRLSGNLRGPRYDHLRPLKCEIQVRTVVQDAWAVVEHYLNYKDHRSPESQRVLSGLAATFELADKQFQDVRDSVIFGEWRDHKVLLTKELSIDTLRNFLAWRFGSIPIARNDCLVSIAFDLLTQNSYRTVRDLNQLIEATRNDRERLASATPSAVVELLAALGLKEHAALTDLRFPESLRRKIRSLD